MHLSFTVPTWALVGFGTIAYPSIGALIASFLMRASNRRLPGFAVALSGVAWPLTLALGAAVFPLWLSTWFVTNYGTAIKNVLQNGMFKTGVKSEITSELTIGQRITVIRSFGPVTPGWAGSVTDQRGSEVQIFDGTTRVWVPADCLSRS